MWSIVTTSSAVLPLLLVPTAVPPLGAQDGPRPAAAVVDELIAAYNAGDDETIYRLVAPGLRVFQLQVDSLRLDLDGAEAFRARLERQRRQWEREGIRHRIEVLDRLVSDFLVIQRERRTLHLPEGEPFSYTYTVAYRVRDGRIIRRLDLIPTEMVDSAHVPPVLDAAFARGEGPTVWIDAGHNAMHTAEGTYWAFGEMLRQDGFRVRTWDAPFTDSLPPAGDVLVVANTLAARNVGDWSLPTPSAFAPDEIDGLVAWVRAGGRLLLIADHMPFPGAAADLAARFGFQFRNGFAVDTSSTRGRYGERSGTGRLRFTRTDGSLAPHPIREGRGPAHAVDSVWTFTGQAFRSPPEADPLLILSSTTVSIEPDTAWVFSGGTPAVAVGGWHQGAALDVGSGRLVVLGEAAQFRPGGGKVLHGHNGRFARNVVEWLAGVTLRAPGDPR